MVTFSQHRHTDKSFDLLFTYICCLWLVATYLFVINYLLGIVGTSSCSFWFTYLSFLNHLLAIVSTSSCNLSLKELTHQAFG